MPQNFNAKNDDGAGLANKQSGEEPEESTWQGIYSHTLVMILVSGQSKFWETATFTAIICPDVIEWKTHAGNFTAMERKCYIDSKRSAG